MNTSICAVTVAYNNPRELGRLLSSLENQDDALDGLIIIDNSDDDQSAGNREVLSLHSRRYLFTRYLRTQSNRGSAAGFRSGMKIAHEQGFSWVWLLDQDGAVSPGCLTQLLRYADKGDILCPDIRAIDEPHTHIPKIYANNFLGGWYPAVWCLTRCQIQTFGTHGVLISKKALDTIGYYDDSFFFVGWEDYDYGYRATRVGLAIRYVGTAEALHPSSRPSKIPKTFRWFPVLLQCVTEPEVRRTRDKKTSSISPFSQAYLESKHLKSWQFGVALVYSSLFALYHKATQRKEVSLTATLRLFVRCLTHNMRKDWPYSSVEQLCREILVGDT